MNPVQLTGQDLTLQDVCRVAKMFVPCIVAESAWDGIRQSRAQIDEVVRSGSSVYGVTTGFGKLSDVSIAPDDALKLQVNLLRSHAVGVGEPFPTDVVRAMLLLRANALVKGFSGVREETISLLLSMLNRGIHPIIPSQGSLGASGDLAPLAHMALTLIGEGEVEYQGRRMQAKQALQETNLEAITLGAKEGLALINGTQAMSAVGALALVEAEFVGYAADIASSLTMEALQGVITAFDDTLLATRPYKEPREVASRIRTWLQGSERVAKQGQVRVQDAYSLRCIPQVHGASWQTVEYAREKLMVEINSATDNPIVLTDGRILSGGQFHGQPIAIAMDVLKIGVSEWASISERRTERLVNPHLSGMSPFLANQPGLESGLMISQYVAAALVSENKVLSHPASVDSIPSSANQEDHVSMGTISARQARDIVANAARVIAIEMICASQALFLVRAEVKMAETTRKFLETIRVIAQPLEQDASVSSAIESLANHILLGQFQSPASG